MILCVSQEYYGESVPIPFPATAEEVREELGKLDTGSQPLFIRGDGPVWHFEDRLDPAVLYQETGVEKLNRLAGLVDAMDLDAQPSPSRWPPPPTPSVLTSPPQMMNWNRRKGRWGWTIWTARPSGMWRSATPGRTCCPGMPSPWRTPTSWPSASEG